ncbi:MAG: RsmE family RNA methyltransferase [Bdellovibrionota bacterium]
MNFLIFDDTDLDQAGRLQVNGRRAAHLIDVLRVEPGKTVRVGKLNGNLGDAVVRDAADGKVTLDLQPLSRVVPKELDVTLILATPRPQTIKKVLQSAAAIGVSRILLIGAVRVEKAYFSSPVLRPDRIREELILGLEQAGGTSLPEVTVLPRCRPGSRSKPGAEERALLAEDVSRCDVRLLPHPSAVVGLAEVVSGSPRNTRRDGNASVAIAVGPEGGWIDVEVAAFEELGFQSFRLGHRVLRVETAVDVLLGQLQLLRAMDKV